MTAAGDEPSPARERSAPEPSVRAREQIIARWLLLGALLAGIALMLAAALRPVLAPAAAPLDAVAMVNGAPITWLELQSALAAVEADRAHAEPLDRADAERLRARLIDEELLFQYALETDLARHEPTTRKLIIQNAVDLIVREVDAMAPERAEMEAFLAENPGLAAPRPHMRLEHFAVADPPEAARARAFLDQGGAFGEAASRFGDPGGVILPGGFLDQAKLADYLGAQAAAQIASLEAGDMAGPLFLAPDGSGRRVGHFVLIVETAAPQPLSEQERLAQAEIMWRSIERDRRLAQTLERLRAGAEIELGALPAMR